MEPETAFAFQNVHKAFGSNRVLRGLSFSAPKGKITFIIGRSGEGKSVTIKHLVGVHRPDNGHVIIQGADMAHATEKEWQEKRRKIGLLFQDGALFDSLSVFENVAFTLREFTKLKEPELEREVERLIELVGLPGVAEKMPSQLSIGEKKRIGLARALAMNPEIMLYDEPTTSMDPMVSQLIDELILSTQKKFPHLTSVVISHDVHSMLTVAEHIVLLHEGVGYFAGSPADFQRSKDPLIVQFLSGSSEGPLANPIA